MRLQFTALACLISMSGFCQTDDARVLIIGIDGLRSDCLASSETPAIDALISEGLFSPDALNNDITYSGPGWSRNRLRAWPAPRAHSSSQIQYPDRFGWGHHR